MVSLENDTLARIGCECLEQYIEANVDKFDEECWNLISETFVSLFEKTTAYGLFEDTQDLVEKVKASNDGAGTGFDMQSPDSGVAEVSEERQRGFQQVIVKCVLQLMLIQTVNELLSKDSVYCAYPAGHLMQLMECLGKSFHFAKEFNADSDLRMALWRFGKLLKRSFKSLGMYNSLVNHDY